MNPAARPQTSRDRDRAIARLNSITTGTAIVAAIATGAFGALAAATWSGNTDAATTDPAAAAAAASADPGVAAQVPAATDSTGTSAGTALQPTSAPIAAVKKKAKVTSGGSH